MTGDWAPRAVVPAWPAVLTWSAYLACSWTWCIGMFLPTLMLRDFGLWGWITFAVPNVIGAAAVGVVFRSAESSGAFVERHRAATTAFSLITIAFHGYWLAWMARWLPIPDAPAVMLWCALGLLPICVLARWCAPRLMASALLVLSATAIVLGWRAGWAETPLPAPAQPHAGLLWLAPVVAFGFALCPPLDLTLQRARRELPGRAAPVAFAIGFGILFLALIAFSALYGRALLSGINTVTIPVVALVCHLIAQATFTVGVHTRELARRGRSLAAPAAAALLIGGALGALTPELAGMHGMASGEIGYRLFLAAYGLAFPAYLWTVAIPHTRPIPHTRLLTAWAISCALASPFFWMGFIAQQHAWLAPGLLILLLARPAARRGVRSRPAP